MPRRTPDKDTDPAAFSRYWSERHLLDRLKMLSTHLHDCVIASSSDRVADYAEAERHFKAAIAAFERGWRL